MWWRHNHAAGKVAKFCWLTSIKVGSAKRQDKADAFKAHAVMVRMG